MSEQSFHYYVELDIQHRPSGKWVCSSAFHVTEECAKVIFRYAATKSLDGVRLTSTIVPDSVADKVGDSPEELEEFLEIDW